MNEQLYNNQALNEYLLGALPEAETERFDELSFTDEEFADALKAAENDLIDRYVRNDLDGAALEKFETHYLASPVRREKVEFARALQAFAEKKSAAAETVAGTAPRQTLFGFFADFFKRPRPAMQWGFAFAALTLLFFGGWLWRENSRLRFETSQARADRERLSQREAELAGREKQLRDEISNRLSANSETENELARIRKERADLEEQIKKQTQEEGRQRLVERQKLDEQRLAERRKNRTAPPTFPDRVAAIASFVLAPSLRGSRIQTVSIPARAAGVSAALELETDEYAAYRAILRRASGEQILWRSGDLKSKSGGGATRVNVNFPAKLLKSGVYSIELNGVAADGAAEIISDYSFRVVR